VRDSNFTAFPKSDYHPGFYIRNFYLNATKAQKYAVFLVFLMRTWWWLSKPKHVIHFILLFMLCLIYLVKNISVIELHDGDVLSQNICH